MTHWADILTDLEARDVAYVMITVAVADGSTPREAGTKMIVTDSESLGTIGGGHLEYRAIDGARALLGAGDAVPGIKQERFSLGPSLGQCCGGGATVLFERRAAEAARRDWQVGLAACRASGDASVLVTVTDGATPGSAGRKLLVSSADAWGSLGSVDLDEAAADRAGHLLRPPPRSGESWEPETMEVESDTGRATLFLEPVPSDDLTVAIFGAGHVGRAVVSALAGLPCRVVWIDSRPEPFPDDLPANVTAIESDAPEYDVDDMPGRAYFLVMTHSHPLDLKLSEKILRRRDFRYFGLIGSVTKRKQFEKRLLQKGLSPETIARMTCPIGIDGITSKHPAAIAVAAVAQILRRHEAAAAVEVAEKGDAARSA